MHKIFWMIPTTLRQFEYYHKINNIDQFKNECHDFYLLMGIWMLENTGLHEFIVWRQSPNPEIKPKDIVFEVNGKVFAQRFVKGFYKLFNYEKPDITFFNGGFPEYDELVEHDPDHFGVKLYHGTGENTHPSSKWFDKILQGAEKNFNGEPVELGETPFFRAANPSIWKPIDITKDENTICWISDFGGGECKRQEEIIERISKTDSLKKFSFICVGGGADIGEALCKKYGVENIAFYGPVALSEINMILNSTMATMICSSGSSCLIPGIITSGSQLLIDKRVKILSYYKDMDCVHEYKGSFLIRAINKAKKNINLVDNKSLKMISMDVICRKNQANWG